jgi:pimeloyl-ACP methyl ester carboxylesterase
MRGVDVEVWGAGHRVVLVHSSMATGPMEWEGQRPLANEGFQLVVPTRRAYSPHSGVVGEDFLTDGADVVELLGDGAHLVGHSYGGIGAMVAAAARPELIRSLVLAEPPVLAFSAEHREVALLRRELERVLASDGGDRQFLEGFLATAGSLEEFPPEVLDELTLLVPAVRFARPPWEFAVDGLAPTPYPTLVVSGNHHAGFTAICELLARRLGADHLVVEGAGHEIQMMADEFNGALLAVWRSAEAGPPEGRTSAE